MKAARGDENDIAELLSNLDKTVHAPARLMIMTFLFLVEGGDAVFLMKQTGLSWGNLSSHVTKLEEAGYVSVTKEFVRRKPRTLLSLTEEGRNAFSRYRKDLSRFIGLTE